LIVLAIMLAVLLEILDTTIVNVALPTMQGSLGEKFEDASWIVTAYLIAVIIALPVVPWLENRFGRRRYCVISILGFTLASAACGASQSLSEIVFFRVLQGLCGGGILTIARSILRDTFPPEQIGRSRALLALGAVVGPSVGPTVGGFLTDQFSWRWIFFINVVPGVASGLLLWWLLREPHRKAHRPTSSVSFMIVGLGSTQYVLQSGELYDWFADMRIVVFGASRHFTVAFCVWELHVAPHPIVDLRMLRRRAVSMGSALSFGIGFTLFVGIVLGPQFSQSILGFTATLSGNQVLVRALSIAAFIPIAVTCMARLHINPRFIMAAGFGLVGWAGFLSSAATASTSDFWSFGWALAIGGFGFGLLFVPLSVAVLSAVPGRHDESVRDAVALSATRSVVIDRDHGDYRRSQDCISSRPSGCIHQYEPTRYSRARTLALFGAVYGAARDARSDDARLCRCESRRGSVRLSWFPSPCSFLLVSSRPPR
jgi:DHA2 family multidrug resistance protein